MARTLLDRFGLGNERAVANAAAAAIRRQREDRLIADLLAGLRVHGTIARAQEPVEVQRAA